MSVAEIIPLAVESEETKAEHLAAELRGISTKFPGIPITVTGDGMWHADHHGHFHEAPGMGLLQLALLECVRGDGG